MRETWALDREAFERLLEWLDPDRERAGERYEAIRARLVRIFVSRGCPFAEDLADETINRVSRKVPEVAGAYEGDPALYFYGVANRVHMEYVRRSARAAAPPPLAVPADEREYECLQECLDALPPETKALVLDYYRGDKREKIERRREIAGRYGIALNALRIRMHRVRAGLEECLRRCLDGRTVQ